MRYLARYVFKTATGNREVTRLPDGRVQWGYRDSKTGQPAVVNLDPLVWLGRLLQHVLPRHFARVRTFGWLHPAAKVRGNRVRALLRTPPLLTAAEQATWQPPAPPNALPAPSPPTQVPARKVPTCPRCQQALVRIGAWRPGQPIPYPKHPP